MAPKIVRDLFFATRSQCRCMIQPPQKLVRYPLPTAPLVNGAHASGGLGSRVCTSRCKQAPVSRTFSGLDRALCCSWQLTALVNIGLLTLIRHGVKASHTQYDDKQKALDSIPEMSCISPLPPTGPPTTARIWPILPLFTM